MKFTTKVLEATDINIQKVVDAILDGQVVGIPSETVYGLAGNLFSEISLAKIFLAKERPLFDPLIAHVPFEKLFSSDPLEYLQKLNLIDLKKISVQKIAEINLLLKEFWPGPLTVVLPKNSLVPDLATSGLPQLAIRMPDHPVFQKVLQKLQMPIAAPSANRFGRISPTSASHVLSELNGRIPFILDGGECKVGVESTILALDENDKWVLLRPGGLSLEKISQVLKQTPKQMMGNHLMNNDSTSATDFNINSLTPVAPGMLKSHYAPEKKLILLPNELQKMTEQERNDFFKTYQNKTVGILLKKTSAQKLIPSFFSSVVVELLVSSDSNIGYSSSASFADASNAAVEDSIIAAQQLFQKLRALDASPAQILFAEPWLDSAGLGYAIQDRLQRASH